MGAAGGVPGLDPALAKNSADGAVGLAAKRLSANPTEASGRRLLEFAKALDPANENLLYLKALMGLGRPIDPAVIPVQVTDEQYVAYLLNLAKGQPPSYFRLLLYHAVTVLKPAHSLANIELQLARERGVVADFNGIIKRLANTFPPPQPLPRLGRERSMDRMRNMSEFAIDECEPASKASGKAWKRVFVRPCFV